jgi:hypothetical protein
MSAVREQIAPDEYITTGVLIAYDSYSPGARTGAEAARGRGE